MNGEAQQPHPHPSHGAPALALEHVTCTFSAASGGAQPYTAVRAASLQVGGGEFVSVVGPTGCGKSTLLNVAAGLISPTSGGVRVFGEPLAGLNRKAGYLFQSDSLMPWRDAQANVAAGLQFRGVGREDSLSRSQQWLARVGLQGFGNRKSVLFITHDLEEAIALSDRVIVLAAGPGTRPIGEFAIDLARPRDVAEVRMTRRFLELHMDIWELLKAEVLKGYAQQKLG